MESSQMNMIDLLGRIAEVKRIFSVIEPSLKDTSCIAVTSGAQGEGKTTVLAGLAMAAAKRGGGRVLAIDFNWHGPKLHELFGVKMNDDDRFLGDGDLESCIRTTSVENLDIIPAPVKKQVDGQPQKKVRQELIVRLKGKYDVVFIDTSSVFPTNQRMIDPVAISRFADGVVMVTLTNVTPRQELKRACSAIETAGAGIIGIVANQWLNPLV